MQQIQEKLKNPIIAAAAGFAVGLILGWFVIGWGIWPVTWTDAGPADLRPDARVDYLRMAIDSFAFTTNPEDAQRRWKELGETGPAALEGVVDRQPALIEDFKQAAGVLAPDAVVEETTGSSALLYFGLCLVVLLLAVLVFGLMYSRRSRPGVVSQSAAAQAARASKEAERTDYQSLGTAPPLGQFITTYMLGDDLFDDSFSIESGAGEFLGECGVGLAETIGVGDPKKVSAFEIWLFDKNDIQTITKVLMSEYVYNDTATRERLAAKGEPILAQPGSSFVLDTATLQMVVRIVDMDYGQGPLPENSFMGRLTLELAVWPREEETL